MAGFPSFSWKCYQKLSLSVYWCWIKSQGQNFGWSRKGQLHSFARQRKTHCSSASKNWIYTLKYLMRVFKTVGQRWGLIRSGCEPTSVIVGSSVMSVLQPHGLQHARLPCPLPSPGVCSNSCPLSHWCHPTISSSVIPFSSCLQSFAASGSFPMSRLFTSGSQSIGVSASASVLPVNIQGWFLLGLTSLISLQSKGLSRVFSTTVPKCLLALP